jgi:hypothetical protein
MTVDAGARRDGTLGPRLRRFQKIGQAQIQSVWRGLFDFSVFIFLSLLPWLNPIRLSFRIQPWRGRGAN